VGQENANLRRSLDAVTEQVPNGNARFDSLHSHVERLQGKIARQRARTVEPKVAIMHAVDDLGMSSGADVALTKSRVLLDEISTCKTELGQREKAIEKLENSVSVKSQELDVLTEMEHDARLRAEALQARFVEMNKTGRRRDKRMLGLNEELGNVRSQLVET